MGDIKYGHPQRIKEAAQSPSALLRERDAPRAPLLEVSGLKIEPHRYELGGRLVTETESELFHPGAGGTFVVEQRAVEIEAHRGPGSAHPGPPQLML